MELKGTKMIAGSPLRLYQALVNPKVLLGAMPGLKRLEPTGPGAYSAEMEMGVSSIRGRYQGELVIDETAPPEAYRLHMKGQGPGGFIDVAMDVQLEIQGSATALHYTGDAKVGGRVAGVGQRLLGGVASLVLTQFFSAIEEHLNAHHEA